MAQISNQVIKALYYKQDLVLSEICQILKCKQDINLIPVKITELLDKIGEQEQTISYYQEIIKQQQQQLLKYNINVNVSKKILNQETLSQLTINKQQKYLAQVLMENTQLRQENKELLESTVAAKRQQLTNAIQNSSHGSRPRSSARAPGKHFSKKQHFGSPITKPAQGIEYSVQDLNEFTMDHEQEILQSINDIAPGISIKKEGDPNFEAKIEEVNAINAVQQNQPQPQTQSITISSLNPVSQAQMQQQEQQMTQKEYNDQQQNTNHLNLDIPDISHEFQSVQFMDTEKLQADDEREKLINSFVNMMNSGLHY